MIITETTSIVILQTGDLLQIRFETTDNGDGSDASDSSLNLLNLCTVDSESNMISEYELPDDRIVRTDDKSYITIWEFRINFVHFNELLVRNVCFCEQDVHVARHSTCNGMDCVLDFCIVFLCNKVSKFLDLMLAL